MPARIQRKRIKGWKMPANTKYVGRPTKWGNPYERITVPDRAAGPEGLRILSTDKPTSLDRQWMVERYRSYINDNPELIQLIRKHLRGKNLSCWCKLSQVCHADVLLEINANNGQHQCVRSN